MSSSDITNHTFVVFFKSGLTVSKMVVVAKNGPSAFDELCKYIDNAEHIITLSVTMAIDMITRVIETKKQLSLSSQATQQIELIIKPESHLIGAETADYWIISGTSADILNNYPDNEYIHIGEVVLFGLIGNLLDEIKNNIPIIAPEMEYLFN